MSECILCKGDKKQLANISSRISILKLDNFMKEAALKIWLDSNAWSIKIDGKDIDYFLTKAQKEMNEGIDYAMTEIYSIISDLIKSNISFAMWYDTFFEDLPVCENEQKVKDACYDGIKDISGMCEVYLLYNNH